MIMIDTPAWIVFLRDIGSPNCKRVEQSLNKEIVYRIRLAWG